MEQVSLTESDSMHDLSMMTRLAIGLAMVLWLPRLMERFRIPGMLGFILAGVLLGPGLTGILRSDSESIELWAELGKLLFMFFVGFEIDLVEFNRARTKAAIFGGLTFALPFVGAIVLGRSLGYGWTASFLIGSIIASHTLLAHPILARLGLLERESVLVTIGGTIFTDIASMVVLAMALSIHEAGFSMSFLLTELLELAIYVPLVLFGLSKLARKLIVRFGDTPEARVCILLFLIALAAELAQLIRLEGIVGAFLVGIAVKRAVHGKFAIEQLEVLAKALFIPTFFLSTGFLIDLPLLGRTLVSRPGMVFGLIAALAIGKFVAAWIAGRRFGYSGVESRLIFSITIPQMAATLASAVVGYQTKDANGVRLLDAEFVNAVLVLVVATCVAGPLLTEKWGSAVAQEGVKVDPKDSRLRYRRQPFLRNMVLARQLDAHRPLVDAGIMNPTATEILATSLFALAIAHTFSVKQFAGWAHRYPRGSIAENLLHFLAETEVVFGLWAAVLFVGIAVLEGSVESAVHYIEKLNYTEPKFVLVVMVVAATRPVVLLAERLLNTVARILPMPGGVAFYASALTVGPLLGSFITEPAAMTLLAIVLKRRYFDRGISARLAYATLGTLFVNVSIGGTLTHFAAPPVLMVASKWEWDAWFMMTHFGWRAVLSVILSTTAIALIFRRELASVERIENRSETVPLWLTVLHLLILAAVVFFAHHPDVFFGVFMLFLGLTTATREYQDNLKLREGLLVGFFLAGLVTLGSLQEYWLKPLLSGLNGSTLFFGTTALTAITDNAALTYLGSLVEGLQPDLKYALVAGAVTGGGLTVIANAPNPAGVGILQTSKAFQPEGISPLCLFVGAIPSTSVAVVCFWFV